jgi:hypothetical protein
MKTCLVFYSGGGNMAWYHGYAKYLQDTFDLSDPNVEFAGISSGGQAALFLALGVPMEKIWKEWLIPFLRDLSDTANLSTIFPHPDYENVIRRRSCQVVTDGMVINAGEKIHFAVTTAYTMAHESLTNFISVADLLNASMCSSHVPFLNWAYSMGYKGREYIDGAIALVDDNYRPLGPQSDELNYIDIHCSCDLNNIVAMGRVSDMSYHDKLRNSGYEAAKRNHDIYSMFLRGVGTTRSSPLAPITSTDVLSVECNVMGAD